MNHSTIRTIKALAAIGLLVSTLGLTACNTTAGAGQDVSATGRAVTDTAEKVKRGI